MSIMPSHKVHRFMDQACFGKSYWKLHKALDKPYPILKGKHRIVFHDPWSASEVAKRIYPNDPVAVESAMLHIWLDYSCTNDRAYHACLKGIAELNAGERKRAKVGGHKRLKRKNLSSSSSLKQLEKTIKQMIEIRELVRRTH